MSRSIVRTAQAPAAIGPYSQAVVVPVGDKRMVFCSGQIALDPRTGAVIEGDVAGYHYYPGRERVARWLAAEGLAVVQQGTEPQDGWAYWHLLLRAP